MANAAGEPGAQYSYYPYGVVKTASIFDNTFGGSGAVRIGHQGLFFDRLDEPWASERLIAAGVHGNAGWMDGDVESMTGRGVYQNRNRTYEPGMGRFLQRDPLGTGQSINGELAHCGSRPIVDIAAPDIVSLYLDGTSAHAYLGGNPLARTDSSGLFFGLAGALMTTVDAGMNATDQLEEARSGLKSLFGLYDMIVGYQVDQFFDVDWASDWNQGDDWYSASGARERYALNDELAMAGGPVVADDAFPGQTPTKALGSRGHGGYWHNQELRQQAKDAIRSAGWQNVRFNQVIKLKDGTVVRPDLLVYDPNTKKYTVVEVMDSNRMSTTQLRDRNKKIADALGKHVDDFTVPQAIDRSRVGGGRTGGGRRGAGGAGGGGPSPRPGLFPGRR